MLVLLLSTSSATRATEVDLSVPHWRGPNQLSLDESGNLLLVANKKSGSISIIDLASKHVVREVAIGESISSLARIGSTNFFVATDTNAHQLVLVQLVEDNLIVHSKTSVEKFPVEVIVNQNGTTVYLSSLWSRRLSVIQVDPSASPPTLAIKQVVDLTIAPKTLTLVQNETRLLVADAFNDQIRVIDTDSNKVIKERAIPGHKIRGLGVRPDGEVLIVSHQMLNEMAHSVENDVHWGLLVTNDLRWLKLNIFLSDEANLFTDAHMHPLGETGRGAGDPGGIAVSPDGIVLVTLTGVNRISIGREDDFSLKQVDVGRGPVATLFSNDGKLAYIANSLDDSISVLDVEELTVKDTISLGTTPELSELDKGERLFLDASLSHDGWMSCASCHVDGHTNGLLNDNFTDTSFGAAKRVITLLGNAGTAPFAWNGRMNTMEDQIKFSLESTMQSDAEPSAEVIQSLAKYIATLPPAPPLAEARGNRDEEKIKKGETLFSEFNCARCHQPPLYTSDKLYDVGLEDKKGNRKFNPPSLRGVSQRDSFFHDGQAKSLRNVFTETKHKVSRELSQEELESLIAFLETL